MNAIRHLLRHPLLVVFALLLSSPGLSHAALLGYWTFDDKTGNDLSGNGRNLQLFGNADFSAVVPGELANGFALDLTGSGAVAALPAAMGTVFDFSGPFTVAFWFRGWPDGAGEALISKGTGGKAGWEIGRPAAGTLPNIEFWTHGLGSTGFTGLDSAGAAALVRWQHVAFTFDGSRKTIFINGMPVRSTAAAGSLIPKNVRLVLGARDNATSTGFIDHSKIMLDDVAIFNSALLPAEIEGLARGLDPRIALPKARPFGFGEPAGGTGFFGIREVKGNGNINNPGDARFSLSGGGTIANSTAFGFLDFCDPEDAGTGLNALIWGGISDTQDTVDNYFTGTALGCFTVDAPGTWTFAVRSNDGFQFDIFGAQWASAAGTGADYFAGETLARVGSSTGTTLAAVTLGARHNMRLMWFDRDGPAIIEVYAAPGVHTAFNSSFKLLNAADSTLGLHLVPHVPVASLGVDAASVAGSIPPAITLRWDTAFAGQLNISPGIGNVSGARGKITIPSPVSTTTYTLTAPSLEPGAPAATSSVTVTVNGPPVISSFTVTPANSLAGASVTLAWQVQNASALSISPGIGSVLAQTNALGAGSIVITAPAATTTYTLTASNPQASASAQKTLTIVPQVSIASFTASAAAVVPGGSVTLSWQTANATALSISPQPGSVTAQTNASGTGSVVVSNLQTSTTFTLTASNAVSSTTGTVTVQVMAAPVIGSFTVEDSRILPGSFVCLHWQTQNATTVTLTPIGVVAAVGNFSEKPQTSTTYTLAASNAAATVSQSLTVTVLESLVLNTPGWSVLHRRSTGTVNSLAAADALLNGTGVAASASGTFSRVNFGSGTSGEFGSDSLPPLGSGQDNHAVRATAVLALPASSVLRSGINNDDGGRLRVDLNSDNDFADPGETVILDDANHAALTTLSAAITVPAGTHQIEYVFFDNFGDESGEVFTVSPAGEQRLLASGGVKPVLPAATDLAISEFMAANSGSLTDFQGESSDWIEIRNGTAQAKNLAGYFLTDTAGQPSKYALPASVTLAPGAFLVVFASNKNLISPGGEIHTNFKLSSTGEYLALTKQNGAGFTVLTEFAPAFPAQRDDVSFGFYDEEPRTGYFLTPTPGAENNGGVAGFVDGTVTLTAPRGLFSTPQQVSMSATDPLAEIRYTLDGSKPASGHGVVYTGPFTVSATTVVRAAAVRPCLEPTRIATCSLIFPQQVLTQTAAQATALGFPSAAVNGQVFDYAMDPSIATAANQSAILSALQSIPTASLVVDQVDFSSAASGFSSQSAQNGRATEKPASLELLNEDGTGAGQFQINCGVRLRGGASRSPNNAKHSFHLFFRSEYDGDLAWPLFGADGAHTHGKLDLMTAQNFSWNRDTRPKSTENTFLREVFARDTQAAMGDPATRSRYLHLYINGIYWGLYLTQERGSADFAQSYLGGDKSTTDVVEDSGSLGGHNTEAEDGDILQGTAAAPGSPWARLWFGTREIRYTLTTDAARDAKYFALQGLAPDGVSPHPDPVNNPCVLDADNLIRYMLTVIHTGGYDMGTSAFLGEAPNNWYAIRDRAGSHGFQFFCHDNEHCMGAVTGISASVSTNRTGPFGTQTLFDNYLKGNPRYLHQDLCFSPEYRQRFADLAHRALFNGGLLTDASSIARINSRAATVDSQMIVESARWGDARSAGNPLTVADYTSAKQALLNWVNSGSTTAGGPGRAATVVGQLRAYADRVNAAAALTPMPLYPALSAPGISPFGGSLAGPVTVTLTNPNATGTVHFTTDGSDPRLTGGALNGNAQSGTSVTLTTSRSVRARVLNGTQWSALTEAFFAVNTVAATAANPVITEINYHPQALAGDSFPADRYEFIELMNVSTTAVLDLSPLKFTAGVDFDFSTASIRTLAPGARVLVVSSRAAMAQRYTALGTLPIAGEFRGSLDNGCEPLALRGAGGALLRHFAYDDAAPWPLNSDGLGATLALQSPSSNPDPSLAANWNDHLTLHGNPGGPDGFGAFIIAPPAEPHADSPAVSHTDSDADGVADLLEMAFGSDPDDAGSILRPSAGLWHDEESGLDHLSITYPRDMDRTGFTFHVEVSDNLRDWHREPGVTLPAAISRSDGIEYVTERLSAPVRGSRTRFLRLRVVRGP